jgi:hypothetical protein
MFNLRKSLIIIPVLLFILACQAVTSPLQKVEDTAGTAAAFATQAGELGTQVSGLATDVAPLETILPDGSAIPDITGNPFDPQSPPLAEWKGIPVMPQAIVGEESGGVYVYKVTVTATEVEDYYAAQLSSLGWKTEFSIPATSGIAIFMYSKDSQILSISVTDQQDFLLIMIMLQ